MPAEHYEEAMTRSKELKEAALAEAMSEKEQAQIAAHWPDIDEEGYM